jgi:phosphatidylinositol glycan class Z
MRRRTLVLYGILLLVRLFFAQQPSYIHPDELFQGADAVVADIFRHGQSSTLTWEFTSKQPVRSIGPIYLFLSPALYLLRAVRPLAIPQEIITILRIQQFFYSFGIDALIYLLSNTRRKRIGQRTMANVLLFASSYTAWTYHTHTFSNGWETLLVLLTFYLHLEQHGLVAQLLRGVVLALGVFTRPSFVFFVAPLYLIPLLDPLRLIAGVGLSNSPQQSRVGAVVSLMLTAATALGSSILLLMADTAYYKNAAPFVLPARLSHWPGVTSLQAHLPSIVLTPFNNVVYNTNAENLALHGTHPWYMSIVNLGVLMGPAIFVRWNLKRHILLAISAGLGVFCLSWVPHQEARFLLPATALAFTSLDLGQEELIAEERTEVVEIKGPDAFAAMVAETTIIKPARGLSRRFLFAWVTFNLLAGVLFGALHQRGVISASFDIARMQQEASKSNAPAVPMTTVPAATPIADASHTQKAKPGSSAAAKNKKTAIASASQAAFYKTYPAPAFLLGRDVTPKHLRGCSERCTNPGAALNKDSLEAASYLVVPAAFVTGSSSSNDAQRATTQFLRSIYVEVARYPGHLDLDNLDLTLLPAWREYSNALSAWVASRKDEILFWQRPTIPVSDKSEATPSKQSATPVVPAQKMTHDVVADEPAAVPSVAPAVEAQSTPSPNVSATAQDAWSWPFKRVVVAQIASDASRDDSWLAPINLTSKFVQDAIASQGLVLLKSRHPVRSAREIDTAGAARRRVPDPDWRMM